MPVYRFVCSDCGAQFEKQLSVSQIDQAQACPSGHQHVRRVFSPPAIVFKGSGFYKTDHRASAKAESNQ